ncbi:MAG: hypothetical protein QOI66_3985 [Myxococcales bacterium]|jgi:hypothetical protein|nr:hypothetical protein [Myxococcales bacterium]
MNGRWFGESMVLVTCALLLTAGCAAMKRTWQFNAAPVASERLEVLPQRADVALKSATIRFTVRNKSSAPLTIDADTFTLRLPDGTTVVGKTNFFGRAYDQTRGLLERVGWMNGRDKPALAPGASLDIAVAFRQYGRDLRRQPTLTVALDGLHVDGRPAELPPLVLVAPPGAPIGEDI